MSWLLKHMVSAVRLGSPCHVEASNPQINKEPSIEGLPCIQETF